MARQPQKVSKLSPRRQEVAKAVLGLMRITETGPPPEHGYKLKHMNEQEESDLVLITNAITNLWDALNNGIGHLDG